MLAAGAAERHHQILEAAALVSAHASVHQRREGDWQPDVVKQPAQVFQRVRHALQEMSLALIKSSKAVSAQGLHDSNVDIGVVVPHEGFAVKLNETAKLFEIMFEQLLAQFRRQVGLGIVQKRSDVVLQLPVAAALIIHKLGIAVAQHHVPGLEIPVKKVIAGGAQQKLRQAAEIIFQGLFVEGDAGETEKIIFEIV